MGHETNDAVALLLTPEQAAEQLQVPVATLRRWVTEGRIPHHRLGRKTRFSRGDLEAIIEVSGVDPAKPVDPRRGRGRRPA